MLWFGKPSGRVVSKLSHFSRKETLNSEVYLKKCLKKWLMSIIRKHDDPSSGLILHFAITQEVQQMVSVKWHQFFPKKH